VFVSDGQDAFNIPYRHKTLFLFILPCEQIWGWNTFMLGPGRHLAWLRHWNQPTLRK